MRTTARLATLTAAAALATGCSLPAAPEPTGGDYPAKPVKIIVPFAAGGPTDLAARVISQCLGDSLGERFIVENKDGGAGAIGTLEMLRSPATGYTLGVGTVGSLVIAPRLSEHATYEVADVTPISKIYQLDSVLLVRDDSRFTSAEDFFEAAREKRRSVSVAVGGASTEYALELRRMAKSYGVELSVVPFDGGAPAQNALMGGNVDALFAAANQPVLELVDDGTFRALATGGPERSTLLPEQPTLAELGFGDLTSTQAFFSLVAPTGLPPQVETELRSGVDTCLQDDEVRERLGADFIPQDPGDASSIAAEYAVKAKDADEVLR